MSRQKRSQITRDRVLAEGLSAFMGKGYHGTGIQEILSAAGVPKGSFYNYFDSKEDFAAGVVDLYAARTHEQLDKVVAAEGDALENLRRFLATELLSHEERGSGCLLGNLGAEMGGSSEILRKAMARGMAGIRERFAKVIALAQKQNTVRGDLAPEQLAGMLFAAWEGALIRMKVEGSMQPLSECCDLMLDSFFRP